MGASAAPWVRVGNGEAVVTIRGLAQGEGQSVGQAERSGRASPMPATRSYGAPTKAAMYCSGTSWVSRMSAVATAENQPSQRGSETCFNEVRATPDAVRQMHAPTKHNGVKLRGLEQKVSGSATHDTCL